MVNLRMTDTDTKLSLFNADLTKFTGPIYANPDRKLYQGLGLIEHLGRTPPDQPRKSYLTGNLFSVVARSIWVQGYTFISAHY